VAKKYICPSCKAKEGVDIVYGLPDFELLDASEKVEVVLGGCCIEENQPDRQCLSCGHSWIIQRRSALPKA
jgi:hypothetical protein